ncbi:hypothetical protein [Bacteroides acidifaciens]|uniref:hypothetical protein n=1 Tax=Bacteroides acidifaciens TaxID=85831 RepID=UPI0025A56307|nr:hypothetical protein [Bacteroides acidifaciens]
MKQLHNIVAPLVLFCLMMVACLPVLAQEQAGEVPSQTQMKNTLQRYVLLRHLQIIQDKKYVL